MKDEKKTKAQLMEELVELRQRVVDVELRQQVLANVREEVWKMKDPKDMDEVLVVIRKGLEVLEIPFQNCDVNIVGYIRIFQRADLRLESACIG